MRIYDCGGNDLNPGYSHTDNEPCSVCGTPPNKVNELALDAVTNAALLKVARDEISAKDTIIDALHNDIERLSLNHCPDCGIRLGEETNG